MHRRTILQSLTLPIAAATLPTLSLAQTPAFDAITDCHGWIKSSKTAVTVRLEALQQPRHRLAQEQLCRKLTGLMTRTPSGKRFLVEVGEAPV